MTEMINQCCYTHRGAWIAVAPKGVFEQKYIGELSRHSTLPGPEYGNDLSVYETVGYGDRFLIMKTQYGLRDLSTESGRASMFSHGYLINIESSKFDPNVFLTINEENFCVDEESANAEKTAFLRREPYTLKSAVKEAGLTKESYCKLLKCVYQLSVRSVNKQALTIKVGDNNQARALLYCIYAGLLPRYSKLLSSASTSYNFSDMRNIVFVTEVNSAKKFFIPETGENNVLSANVERNLDLLYFVDYGVRIFDDAETIQEYYLEMEQTLAQISGKKQVTDDTLKLAHIMTADPQPSKNCDIVSEDDTLMDVLRFAAEYNVDEENDFVKQYVEKLRAEAVSRGLIKIESPKTEVDDPEPLDKTSKTFGGLSDAAGVQQPLFEDGILGSTASLPGTKASTSAQNSVAANSSNGMDAYSSGSGSFDDSQKYSFSDDNAGPSINLGRRAGNPYRPLDYPEKQRMRRRFESIAKGGPANLPALANLASECVKNQRILHDVQARDEYVSIFWSSLWQMIVTGLRDVKAPGFSQNPLDLFTEWCSALSVDSFKIEEQRNKFVYMYWKSFSPNLFVPSKSKDYQFFSVEEKMRFSYSGPDKKLVAASNFANRLSFLVNNSGHLKIDDWLINLNSACSQYKAFIGRSCDHQQFADMIASCFSTNLVFAAPYDDFYTDDVIKAQIASLVIELNHDDFLVCLNVWRKLFVLFDSARKQNTGVIYDLKDINALERFAANRFLTPSVKDSVMYETFKYMIHLDETVTHVPFDFWIALGRDGAGSPYRFFYGEGKLPTVTNDPIAGIVESSVLLKDEYYLNILLNEEKNNKSKFIRGLSKELKADGNDRFGSKVKGLFKKK